MYLVRLIQGSIHLIEKAQWRRLVRGQSQHQCQPQKSLLPPAQILRGTLHHARRWCGGGRGGGGSNLGAFIPNNEAQTILELCFKKSDESQRGG